MKARYRYILGRRKDRPNQLELEVYCDRKRKYVTIPYNISPNNWDVMRQCVKVKAANSAAINKHLSDIKEQVEAMELTAISQGRIVTTDDIRHAINGEPTDNQQMTIKLFRRYNDQEYQRGQIKEGTYSKHNTEINRLEMFLSENGGDIEIRSFTHDLLLRFDTYLEGVYQKTTKAKLHHTLKMFFKQAIDDNYISETPYKRFKVVKGHTQERHALTQEQLATLENLDRNILAAIDERLVLVLDKLLLSCYCGLRISDNASLLIREIKNTPDGLVIDKITEKMNGVRVLLPLRKLFEGKGEKIVERYLNNRNHQAETLFPQIPDPKVNSRLKTLAMMANIPFNLTFHVARHTCATMLAEKSGNPFLVMKILGHADIKTSMIYIHNSYSATINALDAIKWQQN